MSGPEGVATCDLCGRSDDHDHAASEYLRDPPLAWFLRATAAALLRSGPGFPDAEARCQIVAADLELYADTLDES